MSTGIKIELCIVVAGILSWCLFSFIRKIHKVRKKDSIELLKMRIICLCLHNNIDFEIIKGSMIHDGQFVSVCCNCLKEPLFQVNLVHSEYTEEILNMLQSNYYISSISTDIGKEEIKIIVF